MSLKEKVKSTVEAAKKSILGVFDGECADATITNKNGLDITKEVWTTLFASEDYDYGIKYGHFIGYLGHPDDPGHQDFQHGCIVMTEGHIDESTGKVYGKFNLIDTPVGRVVKAFIDAGVKFGISVRGVGDIVSNSVDPDTFVFRGFDLVTFPAFPESIPTFTAIAASTDAAQRAKYQNVCKAVKDNLSAITSSTAIKAIQEQFAPQSEEYADLEARINELSETPEDSDVEELAADAPIEPADADEEKELLEQKLEAVTSLFADQLVINAELEQENEALRVELRDATVEASRKVASMKRISNRQMVAANTATEQAVIRAEEAEAARDEARTRCQRITAAYQASEARVQTLEHNLSESERTNLTYQCKIEASTKALTDKDNEISQLQQQVRETVTASTNTKQRTSNLDAENRRLKAELAASQKLLSEYQTAYAKMYAGALGVDPAQVAVTASTDVKSLHKMVAATNTANIAAAPAVGYFDIEDEEDVDGLVTL